MSKLRGTANCSPGGCSEGRECLAGGSKLSRAEAGLGSSQDPGQHRRRPRRSPPGSRARRDPSESGTALRASHLQIRGARRRSPASLLWSAEWSWSLLAERGGSRAPAPRCAALQRRLRRPRALQPSRLHFLFPDSAPARRAPPRSSGRSRGSRSPPASWGPCGRTRKRGGGGPERD